MPQTGRQRDRQTDTCRRQADGQTDEDPDIISVLTARFNGGLTSPTRKKGT